MEQSWFCWYVDMLAGYEGDPRRDIFRTRHGGLMFNCWFQILLLVRFVIVVVVFFFHCSKCVLSYSFFLNIVQESETWTFYKEL